MTRENNSKPWASSFALAVSLIIVIFAALSTTHAADDKTQAVLAANSEFYRAFRESDMPAMRNIWGAGVDVAVVHPGWPKLSGRRLVLESWRRILANPNSPGIRVANAKVEFSKGVAIVTCDELLGGSIVRALNIFKLKDGTWKLIFHGGASSASSPT